MANNPSVTFEIKCWEGDWDILLKTGRIKKIIKNCRYPFDERILYVNNVNDRAKVSRAAEKYLKDGTLTGVVFVEDLADKVLAGLGIEKESFKGGYYYSIQELTGIYNCRTKYLLHFTADSIITNKEDWIGPAIEVMGKDPAAFTANPNWNIKTNEARDIAVSEDAQFYRGFLFSDQCYLIRADDFKKPIYGETNPASSIYPKYGGELFEKRVDSYMRNHGLYRLTSKKAYYRHQNFPSDPVRRKLLYLTGINLKKGSNHRK